MPSYDQLYDEIKNNPALLQQRIADSVRVSSEDVLTSMLRQAQVFMEWAYLASRAEMDAKKARLYLEEEIEPKLREEAEGILKANGERATVERKRDVVVQHPDYKTSKQHWLVAQERALVLKRVVDALFQKKDMLQSLNSRQKVEFEALPADRDPFADEALHETRSDGPTVGPRNGEHPPNSEELVSSIQRGRAAFRMKRKERLTRSKMENSDG